MSDHDHTGHDHDHDHGEDHAHEHKPVTPSPAAPPPAATALAEDAGTEALATALRSSFAIVKWVMILLVVLFFCSGIFTVGSQEKAIILRFGNPVGTGNQVLLGPGLHFAFPYPIDEVQRVHIAALQQVTSTTGWYFTTPEQEFNNQDPPPAPLNSAVDGYTITGDGNTIHVRATLTYQIDEPLRFVFDFANASNAVQNALDNALIYVSARFPVDEALTHDRAGFQERIRARVTELAQSQRLGVEIQQCHVDIKPPRMLKASFDAVLQAVSTHETTLNQAQEYEKQTLNRAAVAAAGITNAAETERTNLVLAVQAEAGRFTNVLASFRGNRNLFINKRLTEEIGQVLSNVQEKFYIPENVGGGKSELRLQLSREPAKAQAPTTANP